MRKPKLNHGPVLNVAAENKWAVALEIFKKISQWALDTGAGKTTVAYLGVYMEKCAAPAKTKIKQSELAKLHKDTKEFNDPNNAVRTFMKNTFRPFLKKYFETDGKESLYELTIPLGKYNDIELIKRLSVKDSSHEEIAPKKKHKDEPLAKRSSKKTSITYQVDPDKYNFKLPGKPLSILILTWSVGLLFITITANYSLKQSRTDINLVLIISLIFISTAIAVTAIALTSIVIDKKIFRPAFGKTGFLKLTDEGILFASYSGICSYPDCKRKVELTNEKHLEGKKISYIGECSGNPDLHLYTFDHTSMTGKVI